MSQAGTDIPATEPDSSAILKYQQNRPLSHCPGFAVSVQLSTKELGPLFLGLRRDGLEIFTGDDHQYIFDLEGRPIRFSTPNEYRFRGVSHQGSVVRKRPRGSGGEGMARERLDPKSLDESCRDAWRAGTAARRALASGARPRWTFPDFETVRETLGPILERIESFSPDRIAAEAERFARIYQPVPILPPDHYASLVVQATEGCSFNTCTFCTLYRGIPFRVRSVEEFSRHLRDALAFHGEGLRRFTQIFLGQANALAIPQARLVALLQTLREYVELPSPHEAPARPAWAHGHPRRFTGIGSFLDGFTGLNKTAADYAELRELGITRVYLGVESGSSGILRWLRKPATPDEMRQTISLVKAGRVAADVILLVGVGGKEHAREHLNASIEFLRTSAMTKGDRVFLSEIIAHGDAHYAAEVRQAGLTPLTQQELLNQRLKLAEQIRSLGLQPVPYRIEPFVY